MRSAIPRDWNYARVGDLFEMQLGKMLSQVASSGPDQAPYVANRHVQWDRVVLDDLDTMSFTSTERTKYRLEPGDLLVCEGGEVGRTAIWTRQSEGVCYQKAIHRLRPRNGQIEPRYMLRFMRFAADHGLFTELSSQSSIAHLTKEKLAALRVVTPPLPEQRLIAEILDTVDEAIRKTEAIIAKLGQVKQGLLHDLLTRGIDEHGQLRDPDRHPEQFKDSPLGRIPKEWEVACLGDKIGERGVLQTGPFGSQLHAYDYVDEGVPVVMPQDITESKIATTNIAMISERKALDLRRHRLEPNDVIFSRRGDLSRCAAIGIRETGWLCGTGCLLGRFLSDAIDANWLAANYRHDQVQRQVLSRAVGAVMANLNIGILASLVLPVPAIDEQRRIARAIQAHGQRVERERAEHAKLRLLKKGLMDDLLTGRVRVNNLLAEAAK